MIRRLHHLRNGQSGFVVAIAAAGERAQRLRDMGLLPGVGITVMGRSPMGEKETETKVSNVSEKRG